jgi:predicted DNA-binding transcriptional regulator AlpA
MKEIQLLTAQEAAKLAGVRYSTFCYHVYEGNTPKPVRIGKHNFYRREDIALWKKPIAKKRGPKGANR